MQARRRIQFDISRAEWDFSDCPDALLEECKLYECCRPVTDVAHHLETTPPISASGGMENVVRPDG